MSTGSIGLAYGIVNLLRDHWDELDADFRRFYGLDLAAACFGPDQLGLRRLHVYIRSLPPESSLAREMGWAWDDEREMVATLIELVHDQATSTRVVANALIGKKKWNGPPKPLRWPRPSPRAEPVRAQAPPPPRPLNRQDVRKLMLGR